MPPAAHVVYLFCYHFCPFAAHNLKERQTAAFQKLMLTTTVLYKTLLSWFRCITLVAQTPSYKTAAGQIEIYLEETPNWSLEGDVAVCL